MSYWQEHQGEQSRIFLDAEMMYQTYMDELKRSYSFRGHLRWKKAKGKEYLIKGSPDQDGEKSLGVRSEKTEKIHKKFYQNKYKCKERLKKFKKNLEAQARFVKAGKMNRVPEETSKILREMEAKNILGSHVLVIGTNALYAYEAMANVRFGSDLIATKDFDILLDTRKKVNIASDVSVVDLLSVLKMADRSYEVSEKRPYQIINKSGHVVEVVKPMASIGKVGFFKKNEVKNIEPCEVEGQEWLLSGAKIEQTVMGGSGIPCVVAAPAPNVFAIHKLWLSHSENRSRIKKNRDREQALAVSFLCEACLPQFGFFKKGLKMFPKDVVDKALAELKKADLNL